MRMSLPNHVLKFGGTSMKTAAAIKQVAKICLNNPHTAIVVVSAVGGVTDKLVGFRKRSDLDELIDIHVTIAKDLGLSADFQKSIASTCEDFLAKFINRPISTKDLDEILSLGENLSSLLLFHYLELIEPKRSQWLDATEVILTDDQYGKSIPQVELIKQAAEEKFLDSVNQFYVTQGFIGKSSATKQITTLGRGGSDYSAALFAEAIQSQRLFIYTDVPGVYSCDPNIVSKARQIPQLSFSEMAEMANFGAKILHPATLAPCVRAKVPVVILSTFQPELGGTIVAIDDLQENISANNNNTQFFQLPVVRSITMRKNQVLVTIKSLNMLNAYGFLANIFAILAKYKISIDLITTSEVSVALTIDGTSFGSHGINPFSNPELIDELQKFSDISIEEQLTLVAVIGPKLTGPGVAQQVFAKLDQTKVRAICYGASPSSIGILVHRDDANKIVSSMHQKLIESL